MSALTLPVAERIRDLHREGLPLPEIAERTGVNVRMVNEVVRGRREGRPLNPREQAEEDQRAGWAPLCMDTDEWTGWQSLNRSLRGKGMTAARPCDDCPMGFAADMRVAGRCNGEPRWTPPEPDTDEEPAVTPAEETTPMPATTDPAALDLAAIPATVTNPLEGLHGTARALAIAATVDLHGGDRAAAAKDLGIRTQEVGMALARYGLAPKAETQRAPKNRPAAKAPAATERPRSGPSAPEPVEVAPVSAPEPVAESVTVTWRRDDERWSPVMVTTAEELVHCLRLAAESARALEVDMALVVARDRRYRKLAKQVRRLRRDLAVAWMDRQ